MTCLIFLLFVDSQNIYIVIISWRIMRKDDIILRRSQYTEPWFSDLVSSSIFLQSLHFFNNISITTSNSLDDRDKIASITAIRPIINQKLPIFVRIYSLVVMSMRSKIKTDPIFNHKIKMCFDSIEIIFAWFDFSRTYHAIMRKRYDKPSWLLSFLKLNMQSIKWRNGVCFSIDLAIRIIGDDKQVSKIKSGC